MGEDGHQAAAADAWQRLLRFIDHNALPPRGEG